MSEERRYELLEVLGKGGFGTVYHARYIGEGGFSKEVALKVLNPDMEHVAEIASRLRDEARVLGLIRHRAIVGVDRLTLLDGRWTVVMEYVEGHDLGHMLLMGPIPVTASLEIVAEIAGALNAAYTRIGPDGLPLRLLHRDLKPSNVRITPFAEVKVLDFGIARAEFAGREAKTRSLAFGTPEYMSPERLDFSADTAAGDVYALGAVLYEMLSGVQLGRTSANPAKHAVKFEVVSSTLAKLKTPAPVAELLCRMLAYDAEARPSAAEVARRAANLARTSEGLSLREWVERVGAQVDDARPPEGTLQGSVLVERAEAPNPAPDESASSWTVWDRVATPPQGMERRSPSPVRLTPGATRVSGEQEGPVLRVQPAAPSEPRPSVPPVVPTPTPPVAPTPAPPVAVIEEPPAQPTPSTPLRRSASRSPFVAAAFLFVGLGGAGLWWMGGDPDEPPPAQPTPEAAPPATPPPTRQASVEQPSAEQPSAEQPSTEQAAATAPPAPTTATAAPTASSEQTRSSKVAPSGATGASSGTRAGATTNPVQIPPKTTPADATATRQSAPQVRVSLEGDARTALLEPTDGWPVRVQLPGKVSPGSYQILASFDEGEPALAGTARLQQGSSYTIRCDSTFGKCSVSNK